MGDPLSAIAMIVAAGASAATSAKQQQTARHTAQKNREAQEKQLKEQRLLDAQAAQLAKKSEEDEPDYEIGSLKVGGRTDKGKRKVQAAIPTAPNTGLRVG